MVKSMFYTKDHKTGYIFDPWHYLGPKRRKLLDESWAGLFRKDILCELPVDRLSPFFTEDFGRPTKELYAMFGALIIQQMCDLSDEETMAQLAFNLQWHYALNISDESDTSKYLCPKTLWNMRKIVTDNELDIVLFDQTTDRLARIFKVDADKQRLDSVHIKSNMRRLGRVGIFVKSIHKVLVNLKRQHTEMFETVPQDIVDKYLPEKALSCFSMVKPSDSERTLASVSADLFDLAQRFSNRSDVTSMNSYSLLFRVLKEHCNVTEASDDKPAEVLVKPSKEIPSNSLQNPSDPDAGYDGHKGQGYHIQVMETYCDEEDKDVKSTKLDLITHIEVKPACESDVHALIPALESTEDRGLAPKELLVDTLYGSDENHEAAEAMGVKVISPTMGSKESTINLSDFEFSEKGKITSCPNGHAPVKIKTKKNRHSVAFDPEHCTNCPLINDCPVNKGKKYHYLRYDDKALRIARRRAAEQTPEFKERYRWRAGVEGTMSEYNARTGVKRLRVRGLNAVRFCAILKAIGINIFRATAVRKSVRSALGGAVCSLMGTPERQPLHVFLVFKEQFENIWGRLRNTATPFSCDHQFGLKMAA